MGFATVARNNFCNKWRRSLAAIFSALTRSGHRFIQQREIRMPKQNNLKKFCFAKLDLHKHGAWVVVQASL